MQNLYLLKWVRFTLGKALDWFLKPVECVFLDNILRWHLLALHSGQMSLFAMKHLISRVKLEQIIVLPINLA